MPKKVAVLDGNSLMHRAYHAIQTPMSAPDGTPTNAVFGFLQMFCKFVETAQPDAVICAFDAGKPEFRMQELPTYKAQRPHMDDELRVQFPVIEELLHAMDVPVVKVPGWEGDDILGTIAARDEELGYESLLVTGDKDACQLATELTRIVTTKKGITDVAILGPDEVMEKYGVSPDRFTDYLGLMGDTSDNIPGVPGIGPKTATKLLEEYGSIEGIYEHIGELKGKQRENLEQSKDLAFLSRQIATIVRDLDFPLEVETVNFPSFDKADIEDAFKKYKLASPLARVLKFIESEVTHDFLEFDLGEIRIGSEAFSVLEKSIESQECIGVALAEAEQASLFGDSIMVALSSSAGTAVFEGQDAMDAFIRIVRKAPFAILDAKDACGRLYPDDTAIEALVSLDELFHMRAFDLSLAGYVLNSTVSSYTHETLVEQYLDRELPKPSGKEDADIQKLAIYAFASKLLADKLQEALKADGSEKTYYEIDLPLIPVLMQMERTGAALEGKKLAELGVEAQSDLKELSDRIYSLAGEAFNIDSPKQLQHILFEVMGITPLKKNQRGYSTDASVLNELAKTHEIASLVLKYRELSKIKSTYIDSLPKMRGADGRLHTRFHETVTATGRLSSSNPNLQNIPVRTDFGRRIRECFIPLPDDRYFMAADYSQIELRLLANLSEDEHLLAAFEKGADFHARTAARVFGLPIEEITPQLRSRAKAVNFGIVYGQQAYGLSQSLDIPFEEAREMIDRYFEAYPRVREFLDETVKKATETGYAETMFGRKRRIPELRVSNRQQHAVGERTAMNHPMQGSAADIIKLAMIEVSHRLEKGGFKAQMMLQVHDELDFSVPEDEVESLAAMVKDVMENIIQMKVPLEADVKWGSNWAEAH